MWINSPNAGGCQCITGKLIDVSVCERRCGEENISSQGCTLRFCQRNFSALGSWVQNFTIFVGMSICHCSLGLVKLFCFPTMCAVYVVINNVWTHIAVVHEITLGNKFNNIMVSSLNNTFFKKKNPLYWLFIVLSLI